MNLLDIEKAIWRIEAVKDDPEVAHDLEDTLHTDVLRAIAKGECKHSPAEMAQAALDTKSISFPRWTA